jgi:hypothetical protein
MAAKNQKKSLEGYYTIKFEKYIELVTEVEAKYQIIADYIHDEILKTLPDYWDDTPIPVLMQAYSSLYDIRKFLDDKMNNPPEEEVKLATANGIKDVLIHGDELKRMNVLLLSIQELEADLQINYKISLETH